MTEQDRRNIETVRRFYTREEELAAPDIVWHVPGHNPVSGTYNGRDEYFNLMPSRMAPSAGGTLSWTTSWSTGTAW